MEQTDLLKVFKFSIGSFISIIIAQYFSLNFVSSAGIITILTIQDTKKDTLLLGVKRILSFSISILLASLLFSIFGIHSLTFAIFILLLFPISYFFHWKETVSVNAVIATHFLTEQRISVSLIGNELGLLFIGTTIAILLNTYMPNNNKQIKQYLFEIEQTKSNILLSFTRFLSEPSIDLSKFEEDVSLSFHTLNQKLEDTMQKSKLNIGNTFYEHSSYFITYLEMLKGQYTILVHFYHALTRLTFLPPQAESIAQLLEETAKTIYSKKDTAFLINHLTHLLETMKREPLPVDRKEFENRAILYHLLLELAVFISLKQEFILSLDKEQIKLYYSDKTN